MGVAGVTKIIKQIAPKAIKEVKFKEFQDKKIAVDTLLLTYKFMISMAGSGHIRRSDGKITSHIHGFVHRIRSYLANKIHPVFVLDGKAPSIKGGTLKKRRMSKEEALDVLDSDKRLTKEDKIKLVKRSVSVTDVEIRDVKKLFQLFGLPYVQSLEEADPQCAALNISHLVYAVASEDIDILFFGAPRLLKDFSERSKLVQMINLPLLLKTINFTLEQWVEFGVLLGCDYCTSTIKGLTGMNAYKVYKQYGSLEKLIKALDKDPKYKVTSEFRNGWKPAKEYYLKAAVYKPTNLDLIWKEPDYKSLYNFLVVDNEFKKDSVNKMLDDVKKAYNKYNKTQK